MNNYQYENILIISHTCFSNNDSMGSTLSNYLSEYDESKIYQFYLKNMNPNCFPQAHYYRWTDKEVFNYVKTLFLKKTIGTNDVKKVVNAQSSQKDKLVLNAGWNKRSFGLLIRHFLWSLAFKHNKSLKKWVSQANPKAIVLMPGDFQFLFKMAYKIAKIRKIPIIIMQCESYLLKPNFSKSLIYKMYRKSFAKWYKRAMKLTRSTVYLCPELEKDYRKIFPTARHVTIYKPFKPLAYSNLKVERRSNSLIYAGNLGLATGRLNALFDLCSSLSSPKYKIQIFTNTPYDVLKPLHQFKNVSIKGLIGYEELVKEYLKSEFIIHIENSRAYHLEDLKYAFSTKISDILSYGCVGLVVGSDKIAGINYLKRHNAAIVIEKPREDLGTIIDSVTSKKKALMIQNCIKLLEKNHSKKRNSNAFISEIINAK